jgi:hypothetical protein
MCSWPYLLIQSHSKDSERQSIRRTEERHERRLEGRTVPSLSTFDWSIAAGDRTLLIVAGGCFWCHPML